MSLAGQTRDVAVHKGWWTWTEPHWRKHCCRNRSQLESKVHVPPAGVLLPRFSRSLSRRIPPPFLAVGTCKLRIVHIDWVKGVTLRCSDSLPVVQ
jgi:hypothetical protein